MTKKIVIFIIFIMGLLLFSCGGLKPGDLSNGSFRGISGTSIYCLTFKQDTVNIGSYSYINSNFKHLYDTECTYKIIDDEDVTGINISFSDGKTGSLIYRKEGKGKFITTLSSIDRYTLGRDKALRIELEHYKTDCSGN